MATSEALATFLVLIRLTTDILVVITVPARRHADANPNACAWSRNRRVRCIILFPQRLVGR